MQIESMSYAKSMIILCIIGKEREVTTMNPYNYYEAAQSYNGKYFYLRHVIGPDCGQLVRYCDSMEEAEKFANLYNKCHNLKKER